jgi:hypothetical protein
MTTPEPESLEWMLDAAVEVGRITRQDADEVLRFASFIQEAGPPNGPYHSREQAARAYRKHYPEEVE